MRGLLYARSGAAQLRAEFVEAKQTRRPRECCRMPKICGHHVLSAWAQVRSSSWQEGRLLTLSDETAAVTPRSATHAGSSCPANFHPDFGRHCRTSQGDIQSWAAVCPSTGSRMYATRSKLVSGMQSGSVCLHLLCAPLALTATAKNAAAAELPRPGARQASQELGAEGPSRCADLHGVPQWSA